MATTAETKRLKPKKYDKRTPDSFMGIHRHVRGHKPSAIHEIVRLITAIYQFPIHRTRVIGIRHVWRRGPWIMAPVHFSNFDHFLCAMFTPRRASFMAKSNMFRSILRWVLRSGGTFPAVLKQDKKPDWESLRTARSVIWRGGVVIKYCWGGRNRLDGLPQEAKFGIGWVALETGAPVVPAAIYGSERIRNTFKDGPPKITVEYGRAFSFVPIQNPNEEQCKWAANVINSKLVALQQDLEARKGRRRHGLHWLISTLREEYRFIVEGDARPKSARPEV